MRVLLICLFLLPVSFASAQTVTTRFEQSKALETPAYAEIIAWWKKLDEQSGKVKMLTMGTTDAGFPLHLVIVSENGDSDFDAIRKRNKRIILINNGIHPGEPDGIDASMLLVRDILSRKYVLPSNIVLAIIPVYNIGGCLDRSADYRVDQEGPAEFGFRGNSENYDLNRDFIKCDSKDARAFATIFHMLDPDVFVDNHVSDGADYQHVMTLLSSQHNKLGGAMGDFMYQQFEPGMFEKMKTRGYDLVPYVNFWGGGKIEEGWQEFWDSPRYGSGYASLFNTFAFVPETHMLKPYAQRVQATYALMQSFIEFTSVNSEAIRQTRQQAKQATIKASSFPLRWKADRTRNRLITYKGYESGSRTSNVSGLPRMLYDRSKPYEKQIPFFDQYLATEEISKPAAYIIPQGWWKVIELLKLNKVVMRQFSVDTTAEVEVYHLEDYKSGTKPYEGHHLNSAVVLTKTTERVRYRKGDYLVPMDQVANRFVTETLEPQAEDSYFAWNFFDPILAQKEGYAAYAFEDIAAGYLKAHPDLQKQLDEKRKSDAAFAANAAAQLNYVYQHSPWVEPAYMRYPVTRLLK